MNRKAYASILAIISLALVFLPGCNNSSAKRPPVVAMVAQSGTPQSAPVSTAFAAPLVAQVTTDGVPTGGVAVTFTAPSSGASGTFANTTNTETDTTDVNGLATSSTFTANATGGAYTVTATALNVQPVNFSLTNTAPVESVTANSGTPQSTAVATAFAAPLVALVATGGTPMSGVSVTFTAPASGASGTFASNSTNTETQTTDVNGLATSSTFTANGTTGSYSVTAAATGASSANFSLTNTAVPSNNYAFYLTGSEAINGGPNFYALAGSVSITATGTVLGGEQDYNDAPAGNTSPNEPTPDTITGGTLTVNGTTGQGTLTLITNNPNVGVAGTETLGVQFVNANHALIVQFDGSATSSGSLDLQTLPSTLSGGYAFTLSGVDSSHDPVVFGGVFSIAGTALQNGVVDKDVAGSVTVGKSFTGTLSAPDSFGRGTVTGTGQVTTLSYYIVGPEVIRIIDVDAADSAVGSAFSQGSGTFSNASLGNSVFGVSSNSLAAIAPVYAAAGVITTTGNGSFAGVADNNEEGIVYGDSSLSGGTYTVASNGYGNITIPYPQLGDVVYLGIYMTDPALNLNDPNNATGGGGALLADLDGSVVGTGVLIPQTDATNASFTGNYAFGAQDYWGCGYVCEFDFVGQGSVSSLALNGAGLISDPYGFFGGGTTYSGVTFTGTATPDGVTAGRYTIPLLVGGTVTLNAVIYQASGGQLTWVGIDPLTDLFLGSLEQQGSLSGMPAAKKGVAKTIKNRTK